MSQRIEPAILIVVTALHTCYATTWLLLGMPAASQNIGNMAHASMGCDKLGFLPEKQRWLCHSPAPLLESVAIGARMGIKECQHQFSMNRWNCSTLTNSSDLFGEVVKIPTREKAFVNAISAAGVMYAITRACTKGELEQCHCDERVRRRKPKGEWEWGGCSEDFKFGSNFSRFFVDALESRDISTGLMNLHNNEAGRRAIRKKMTTVCKCHGISGSCSMKVCWRKMPPFRKIGNFLKKKHEGASKVKVVTRKRSKGKRLKRLTRHHKKPTKKDMVFLQESPDYCEPNVTLGVLGTHGRLCNKTSYGMDGCSLLCCGRGYQTLVRRGQEKCECRFVWCCNVQCSMCNYTREEHYCN